MSAAQKTFLLGVGAQKAGTSWVYDFVNAAPGTQMGPVKEYHVLDALYLPECRHQSRRPKGVLRSIKRAVEYRLAPDAATRPKWVRYRLQASLEAYVDFFCDLLDAPEVRLTGDITPSYSGLSAERLADIKARFAARGIATKVVYLMRDPVARLISAVAMAQRSPHDIGEGIAPDVPLEQAVADYFGTPAARLRSDYAGALSRITEAFAPEERFIGLFETLFMPETHQALANFLGVPPDPARLGRKSYAAPDGQGKPAISDGLRARIVADYASSYSAAQAALPGVDLSQHWSDYTRAVQKGPAA